MLWATVQALCGLLVGLALGSWLGLGPVIGAAAQRLIDLYELLAPVLVFAILGPSILKLLRQERGNLRRFALFAVAWFSLLRLAVCIMTLAAVIFVYHLPLWVPDRSTTVGNSIISWNAVLVFLTNRYLLTFAAACCCAWFLRSRNGMLVERFLQLPDMIEAAGNLVTRLTGVFGILVGIYIVSVPGIALSVVREVPGATMHPLPLRWLTIDTTNPHGVMAAYLLVTAITGILCILWHSVLVIWSRLQIPDFSVKDYISGYLVRVYPLIWSTGAESLAIPTNLSTLRRYGHGMSQDFRDLTIGLAATLNLNGTLVCCLVLVPAVCLTIGYPLTVSTLLGCLPLIFFLGYAIPGIPGELVIFADPIAGALGLAGAERHLFLMLFLTWQVGLTDAFRSAGSATDGVPATLLLDRIYHSRFSGTAARKWIAGNAAFAETMAPPHVRLASNRIESGPDGR